MMMSSVYFSKGDAFATLIRIPENSLLHKILFPIFAYVLPALFFIGLIIGIIEWLKGGSAATSGDKKERDNEYQWDSYRYTGDEHNGGGGGYGKD